MSDEILIFTIDDKIIDIEWCYNNGHTPPHERHYRYKVDDVPYVTEHHQLKGEQILHRAGKTVKEYMLRKKVHGSWVTVEPDEEVDFHHKGLEKFKTIKKEHNEGESDMQKEKSLQRDFSLLEEDEEYLNSLGLFWETVLDGSAQWVLVHDYPIPAGYNVGKATVAARITPGYPVTQLDMLYFYPQLGRLDSIGIGGLSTLAISGVNFQQWSRHRPPTNPWRQGIDDLSTHIPLVEVWLEDEFIKKPSNGIRA